MRKFIKRVIQRDELPSEYVGVHVVNVIKLLHTQCNLIIDGVIDFYQDVTDNFKAYKDTLEAKFKMLSDKIAEEKKNIANDYNNKFSLINQELTTITNRITNTISKFANYYTKGDTDAKIRSSINSTNSIIDNNYRSLNNSINNLTDKVNRNDTIINAKVNSNYNTLDTKITNNKENIDAKVKTLSNTVNQNVSRIDGAINGINQTIENNKETTDSAIEEISTVANNALTIAKGKATGYVFDTVEDMQNWIADNIDILQVGDNLYIKDVEVPDYWWDGTIPQQLETQKVDLSNYVTKDEIIQEVVIVDVHITNTDTQNNTYKGTANKMDTEIKNYISDNKIVMWHIIELDMYIPINQTVFLTGIALNASVNNQDSNSYYKVTQTMDIVNIKLITYLDTTTAANIYGTITEINNIKNNIIGNLSSLTTNDKTKLVSAINELVSKVDSCLTYNNIVTVDEYENMEVKSGIYFVVPNDYEI